MLRIIRKEVKRWEIEFLSLSNCLTTYFFHVSNYQRDRRNRRDLAGILISSELHRSYVALRTASSRYTRAIWRGAKEFRMHSGRDLDSVYCPTKVSKKVDRLCLLIHFVYPKTNASWTLICLYPLSSDVLEISIVLPSRHLKSSALHQWYFPRRWLPLHFTFWRSGNASLTLQGY